MNSGFLKSPLIRGATLLTAASILTRVIGLVNRMVLSRLVGAEGLGLYQMVLPLYALLAVGAGLGLSGAITRMVAQRSATGDKTGALQIRRLALRLVLAAALLLTALLWGFMPCWSRLAPDSRILGALVLTPFAFTLAALSSILRSYTQGQGRMLPTALAQVAEQVVRVAVGLTLAALLFPYGLESVLQGLFGGIIAGELACLLLLHFMKSRVDQRAGPLRPGRLPPAAIKELFSLALPILLIRLSTAFTQTVESLLIPGRLQAAGFSAAEGAALYGHLAGMALPLLFLPTVLIIPLNTTLVPAITTAMTLRRREQLERLIKLSLWGALGLGTLSAALLFWGAPALTGIFYNTTAAAALLTRLAPIAPFAYLQMATAAILYGMGRPGYAVSADLLGTVLGLAIIYRLAALPQWGIHGVTCGYTAMFIAIALLDYLLIVHFLKKV